MKSFKQFLADNGWYLPRIRGVIVTTDNKTFELRESRKWVPGRFDRNIGIDQPTHGVGQTHAHVYGRKKGELVLIVNLDGTGSHGTKGKLHQDDADALRARGFSVAANNVVEWCSLSDQPQLLFG